MTEQIHKGAFQLARQIFSSEIWLEKPATWKVIWIYILGKVSHKDNGKFERGEGFFMPTKELKEIGIDVSIDIVKKCLVFLRKKEMISTRRSTRGVYIKVLKYNTYQTLDNYQGTGSSTKKALEKHQRSTTINKNVKNEKNEKNITKVIETKVSYGNTDINFLLKEFEDIMKFKSSSSKDRIFGKHLTREYNKEQLTTMLKYCSENKYAPRIGSLEKMWYKRGDIIAGIKAEFNKNKIQSL